MSLLIHLGMRRRLLTSQCALNPDIQLPTQQRELYVSSVAEQPG